MAGNNSCGSRSLPTATWCTTSPASAWLSDGELVDFGPVSDLGAARDDIALHVRQLVLQHRSEIHARWPKVMRRVAGYNLDIFDSQSEKPYTGDGSVNLAHLLIGAEGTLAYTRSADAAALGTAAREGAGRRRTSRPSTRAMDAAQHIVKLGPLTAVELVDRTMIELSAANPAFGRRSRPR